MSVIGLTRAGNSPTYFKSYFASTCNGAFGIAIVHSCAIFTNTLIIMVVNSPEIHIEPFRFFPTPKNQKSNMVFAHLSAGVFERWYRRYELLPKILRNSVITELMKICISSKSKINQRYATEDQNWHH
ncbi:hypothetical protein LOAG_11055 [Loa loa]|uniref:Uncharacterized protein n=1 Tax=Loa loa TaxID=7209 RepID=A0A1S0TP82_LOALO|nr:hypothetical protein LOAG_11055 [Loa loa]EFO17444.1 hypothetical protein LOAG_11055 [Loa loa]